MATRPAFDVEEARSDTTPMIDVVFLMIIFFVCIDFRVLEAKLPAFLPRDRGSGQSVVKPEEQLALRIHVTTPGTQVAASAAGGLGIDPATGRPARFRLHGHRVAWEIGPRRFDDLDAATRELMRIAADPSLHVLDAATGERQPIPCVVEGLRGSRYDDIARAADACRAAGFTRIHFGGGVGAD